MLTTVVALLGCVEPPELKLDGPGEVVVDHLGTVQGPRAVLPDGHVPDGVTWRVAESSVARIEDGQVVAFGAGSTDVVGSWDDQQVVWTLKVEPALVVAFVKPPPTIAVGATVPLTVQATFGGSAVEGAAIAFSSSDPKVLEVAPDGAATGKSPGMAYIMASSRGSEAMVEITVE